MHLAVLDQLTVVTILELDYLMDVGRRGCRAILTTLACIPVLSHGARLKLGLLPPFVALTVVVRNLEDLLEVLGWDEGLLGRRRVLLRSRLGVG